MSKCPDVMTKQRIGRVVFKHMKRGSRGIYALMCLQLIMLVIHLTRILSSQHEKQCRPRYRAWSDRLAARPRPGGRTKSPAHKSQHRGSSCCGQTIVTVHACGFSRLMITLTCGMHVDYDASLWRLSEQKFIY